MLEKNVEEINNKISKVCLQAKRSPNDITLISVTKSVDANLAAEIVNIGVNNLAENRVDKLLEKYEVLKNADITWHLIGNLQRRKVKKVINLIDYFHALDRIELAEEIQKRAIKPINCFVEVNVSGEASKQGISLAETEAFIKSLAPFSKIKVVGLMTMAPFGENNGVIRSYFHKLQKKQKEIAKLNLPYAPCSELSMGMSEDFELAILEGATYIRVGRACFK